MTTEGAARAAPAPAGRIPAVTIGMPMFNGGRFLRRALDSLLGQRWDDFELVISDNASTDGSLEVCREYAARDPRIRIFQQEVNRGALANWEFVLRQARAEKFMWAACDDEWSDDYVGALARTLDRHPAVDFAYGPHQMIDEDSRPTGPPHEMSMFVSNRNPLAGLFRPGAHLPRFYNGALFYLRPNPPMIYGMYRTRILRDRDPLFEVFQGNIYHSDNRILIEVLFEHRAGFCPDSSYLCRERERSLRDYDSAEPSRSDHADLEAYLLAGIPGSDGGLFKRALRGLKAAKQRLHR